MDAGVTGVGYPESFRQLALEWVLHVRITRVRHGAEPSGFEFEWRQRAGSGGDQSRRESIEGQRRDTAAEQLRSNGRVSRERSEREIHRGRTWCLSERHPEYVT